MSALCRPRLHLPLLTLTICLLTVHAFAQAQAPAKPYEPQVGQAGKDVVWVPTPQALVDKMMEMAKVTPQDYLIDLGSGDGRTVITAAKIGATAHGIEYEPEMVALAQRNAADAGVAGKATFAKADLFESDFSKATVITMFLLPQINMKLRPTLLEMKPGTRIVSNTFTMEDWDPDQLVTVSECTGSWCSALLWIVPAKVAGSWQTPQGELKLTQTFQKFEGTIGSTPIANGKLNGAQITFDAAGGAFSGTVNGNTLEGVMTAATGTRTNIRATRASR